MIDHIIIVVCRFRNVQGLEYILAVHLEELQTRHEAVVRLLYELSEEPTEDLINQTVDCCLRPADQILKTYVLWLSQHRIRYWKRMCYDYHNIGSDI